jgi:RNA polymerase sigma factor (sigma-70 family)
MIEISALTPDQLSDTELINLIFRGEKKFFEFIMRRYNQRLFRIGMSMLNDDMEVEDAMQSTYVKAYMNLAKFEERASLGTWLVRILLNECLAKKNRESRFNHEFERYSESKTDMETPAKILHNKELGKALENAVAKLPEKYRLVFVLRELEDMSVKETGAVLGIQEPNVKVRLNRAKTILRENLNGYFKENIYNFHFTRCDRIVYNVFLRLQITY